jgi:hypothetical protein
MKTPTFSQEVGFFYFFSHRGHRGHREINQIKDSTFCFAFCFLVSLYLGELCTSYVQVLKFLLRIFPPTLSLPLEGGELALWSKFNYSTG